ncbi:MAG TPA: LysM peptidoglycan-binding domain-containing protein [Dongiaceae bacterium]|nr:LysM peptidoglycan-binding domain-containing protein [Dongiaceae bacterium]
MTRVALTGTIGAAVLVVALGLFFAIYQQDQDDSGDAAPAPEQPAAPQASGDSGGDQGTATAPKPSQSASTGDSGTEQSATGGEGEQGAPPSFDVVRVNPSGDAVIAGRAEPDAEVTILDQGKPIGSVKADGRGEWVFLPDSALDPGEHSFTLESKPEDAAESAATKQESETSVVVLVPQVAKDIAGRTSEQPSGALAIEVPKSGTGPTRVLNVPNQPAEASAGASKVPEISAIDYDAEGRAVLSGRAPEGARLFVYLDNDAIGEAIADENGLWTFTPSTPIKPGLHVIRVDQVDETGKVLARTQTPFEQATVPLAAQAGSAGAQQTASATGTGDASATVGGQGRIVVQPGNSLWKLARESYGHGVQYTVIYEANKDQISNPDLIYPGQVFAVPTGN